jgi:hypothetical protein
MRVSVRRAHIHWLVALAALILATLGVVAASAASYLGRITQRKAEPGCPASSTLSP